MKEKNTKIIFQTQKRHLALSLRRHVKQKKKAILFLKKELHLQTRGMLKNKFMLNENFVLNLIA